MGEVEKRKFGCGCVGERRPDDAAEKYRDEGYEVCEMKGKMIEERRKQVVGEEEREVLKKGSKDRAAREEESTLVEDDDRSRGASSQFELNLISQDTSCCLVCLPMATGPVMNEKGA